MMWWMWMATGAVSATIAMAIIGVWLTRGHPVDRNDDGAEAEERMHSVRAKLGELS